ncbi:MAG: TrkH family potassium uptake protein [Traorella sp.]
MKRKKVLKLSSAQKIVASFLFVIIIGAILLSLPICNKNHQSLDFIDALFTATSATCVTGLVTKVTMDQFNIIGQSVILCMIQIGGIGLMTIVVLFTSFIRHKISMSDKVLIKEQLNQSSFSNLKSNVRNITKYILIIESIGAFLLSFVFVKEYGPFKGIYNAIFISISAFCNAGFDNLTHSSLVPYADNIYVLVVIMILIILGGLGFIVWFDVKDKLMDSLKRKKKLPEFLHSLTLHTKLVLIMTVGLIVVPAILIFVLEYHSSFYSNLNFFEKVINALFSSVTLRTAGFASMPIENCQMSSLFVMIMCMFVGGSPGGTAGGIKTTTLAVLLLCVYSHVKGFAQTNVFHRHVTRNTITQATTIFTFNLTILFLGIFLMTICEDFSFLEIVFECTSALATVGLSMGITPMLSFGGKVILICMMYVGRIGIITFVMSLIRKEKKLSSIQYAQGNILLG